MRPLPLNNVILLAISQMLGGSGLTVVVILGGIVAADIAPSPAFVTVPVSLAVIAVALTTVPATMLMRRIGRRAGFMAGALLGACGAAACAQGIAVGSFELFCGGSLLIGASLAFTQQYRFAAAESVPSEQMSRAISRVLIGGLGAAIIGPQIALAARWLTSKEYVGSFLAVGALYLATFAVLWRLKPVAPVATADTQPSTSVALFAQSNFRIAVLAGTVAYAVMTFVMTAAPISMHGVHHHSLEATTVAIQSHVLAMFLPSLFSGQIIARWGERPVMLAGTALLACCAFVSFAGAHFMHYWWALVLLGVGWNLLFVAGTTLLVRQDLGANRHRAQAINEFTVFGTQACASLLAGLAVEQLGWQTLNLATLPLLAAMMLVAMRLRTEVARQEATL